MAWCVDVHRDARLAVLVFFKQKTAYEIKECDWSSDVCSSDLGEYAGALIVDDYAHHPTEIRATLDAARRGYPARRLIALFQPHLYSRTRDFADDFARAFKTADVAIVAPIYAAREKPIEGVSARMIADAESGIELLDRSNSEIYNEMRRRLEPNDIFITMGAGDVHEIAEMLVRGAAA